ncbi:MAG: hypothetical protein K2X49_23420 [Acetobacteraceae bacterium]|nr:hypothetical protein [Acetobacteraceae bacterium]
MERLKAEGAVGQAALARTLAKRQVPTPRGTTGWTHTTVAPTVAPTVARVLARAAA